MQHNQGSSLIFSGETRVRVAGNMEKKKKKKAFLPWRVIEVEPQYQEKNSDCQEVNGLVYAQWKLSVKETY